MGDGDELFGDWDPPEGRAAWLAYLFLDRSDWRVLPDDGGWFAQDEGLIEEVSTFARMAMYVRAQLDVNESEAEHG